MTLHFNIKSEEYKRLELRRSSTTAERILWKYLKARKFLGKKFRRQYSIGTFVIDFYCPELKLAIELDGKSHDTKEIKIYDEEREEIIKTFGIVFLRFKNEEVYTNVEKVLDEIKEKIEERDIKNNYDSKAVLVSMQETKSR
jgi:very-short-patch-repair endonuclease